MSPRVLQGPTGTGMKPTKQPGLYAEAPAQSSVSAESDEGRAKPWNCLCLTYHCLLLPCFVGIKACTCFW